MDAIAAPRELRCRLRRLRCFLLWRRLLQLELEKVDMYDEVEVVDGELSQRRRLCRGGDISDSEELLWYRRRFDDGK